VTHLALRLHALNAAATAPASKPLIVRRPPALLVSVRMLVTVVVLVPVVVSVPVEVVVVDVVVRLWQNSAHDAYARPPFHSPVILIWVRVSVKVLL